MPPRSWPDVKYPSRRDEIIPNCEAWLIGKQIDDGAEGLWRVYDKLYDMEEFISKHPGGAMWLELTKGTDITEAFECHHLTPAAEKLLPNYYVREATTPRNSPFTFHSDGFYKTLKRRILKHFNYKPPSISQISKFYLDFLFFSGMIFAVMAAIFQNISLSILSGMMFAFVINCGHNGVHIKDTWRNYYYYFTGFSVREWRISHCLSHHIYPNTLKDLEVWFAEPWLQFLPKTDKSILIRYGSWLAFPVVSGLSVFFLIFNRVRLGKFFPPNFLLFVPLLLMLTLGQFQLYTLFLWISTVISCGFFFTSIGLTAAHHDHELFHEGDEPRKDTDWGLYQVDATIERKEIIGNKYLGLVLFGDHILHHLFPTLDYIYLEELMPICEETLREFGVDCNKIKPYGKIVTGTFLQLARNKPNMLEIDQKY